jgi:E3 ubiquitin-protein ligase UBR4
MYIFCLAENYNPFSLLHQKVVPSGDNSWSSAVADFIRNNDRPVIEACDRVMNTYQEEMLPCESFSEFCDVVGMLFTYCTDWSLTVTQIA